MNITDVIWRNSHAWPDRLAVLADESQLSFKALRNLCTLVAARLHEAGLRQGDCVALALPDPLGYLVTAFAAARLGLPVIPFTAIGSEALKETLLHRHRVAALVSGRGANWRTAALAPERHLEFRKLSSAAGALEKLARPPIARNVDNEPWLIALSSGTTGTPKSNAQTHWRAMLNSSLPARPDGTHQPSRLLVFTDLGINLGMSEILRQLYAGATVVLTRSASAGNFFDVVQRSQATHAITTTGSATSLVVHAAKNLPDSAAMCRSLQSITISGSGVPSAVQEGVIQRICAQIEIRYGSTETGFIASTNTAMLASHPDSSGRIAPWVQAQAVDEHQEPLPVGQVGTLRFKTPTAAPGYVGDEEASARAFHDGWFYPGDRGSIDAAGYLTLAGRVDHRINLGGAKLNAEVIEKVINSHPAVLESAVVPMPRRDAGPVAVAAIVANEVFSVEELRSWCSERLELSSVPAHFVTLTEFPKNAGGKILRRKLPEMIREAIARTASGDRKRTPIQHDS